MKTIAEIETDYQSGILSGFERGDLMIKQIKTTVAHGNGGFADFPFIPSDVLEELRAGGFSALPFSHVYCNGWRVFSPAYVPEPPFPEERTPSAPDFSGDVEGAILARQSHLLATL